MKTAVYANYKPMDALSASGIMSDLPHDCGLVSKWCFKRNDNRLDFSRHKR